ncbi:MAG: FHA domain-containing protein [Chloroflexi bacterium]|nr:FHA domain-containing protein [Chloroflexota bacterium]
MVTSTAQAFGRLVRMLPDGRERTLWLTGTSSVIGRSQESDIVLEGPSVAPAHARVNCGYSGCTLVDLGSATRTRVNAFPRERTPLIPGDVIEIGGERLRYEAPPPQLTRGSPSAGAKDAWDTAGEYQELAHSPYGSVPRLVVHTPGKTWELLIHGERVTIGSSPDNDIVADDPAASQRHAYIEREGNHYTLRDLRSTTGTWIHNQRIVEHTLQFGDTIRIGHAQIVFVRGSASEEDLAETAETTRTSRPPVVVIPGMMGSELWAGQERIWPDVRRLLSRPESFNGSNSVQVGGLLDDLVIVPNLFKMEKYSRLLQFLEKNLGYRKGIDLLEFPYDWRQDNRLSARQLADTIDRWKVDGPITIVAHSMGCLVSRYYVDRLGGSKKVERMILIGGPHYGTPRAMAGILLGRGLLPFGLQGERLRRVMATFPSVYQLLPSYPSVYDQYGRPINVFEDTSWLPDAQRPLLEDAAEFRRELNGRCGVPCVSVFGYGLKTITKAVVQRDQQDTWRKVDFVTEGDGDNTIPRTSAVLPGSEIQPVRQQHSALYADKDVKVRLQLELVRGSRWRQHRTHRRLRTGVLSTRRRTMGRV